MLLALLACAPEAPIWTLTPAVEHLDLALEAAEPELIPTIAGRGVGVLEVARLQVDQDLGLATLRMRQTLDGVPVLGGEAIVRLDENAEVVRIVDHLVEGVVVDTTPALPDFEAEALAFEATGLPWLSHPTRSELLILRHEGEDHLVWRVQLYGLDAPEGPTMPLLYVDAHDGGVVWSYDNLKTIFGSGTSNWYGTVDVRSLVASDGSYVLEDSIRKMGVYDCLNTTTSAAYVTDTDQYFTAGQEEAVDVAYGAGKVWDYWSKDRGRKGIDGAYGPGYVTSVSGTGSVISMFVHYDVAWQNAAWASGVGIFFGDGDGTYLGPLTGMDVVGHEWTHGVSEHVAGFTYSGEPGALDEGYADIFGAMAERYALGESSDTWLIGETFTTPGVSGDALREMNNPSSDGFTVSHYADLYTGADDNGGVHINLGIISLAFYLLSEGGSHPDYGGTAMTGIGADAAEGIAWRALDRYMGASSTFEDARNAWLDAAYDIYKADSVQYKAVQDAWSLVGVGDASTTCGSGTHAFTGDLPKAHSGDKHRYYPYSQGYYTANAGVHTVTMTGTGGADLDLYLFKYKASTATWELKQKSKTAGTATESISYDGAAGKYRIYVYAASGSGTATVCASWP